MKRLLQISVEIILFALRFQLPVVSNGRVGNFKHDRKKKLKCPKFLLTGQLTEVKF